MVAPGEEDPIAIGDLVWGNYFGTSGLPYRAEVVDARGDRVKIQPLQGTLTEGSVRSSRPGDALSRRVRWVKASSVVRVSDHEVGTSPSP